MSKEEVAQCLESAAHLLCAASGFLKMEATSNQAKPLIDRARSLVAMAAELAGDEVFPG